MHSMTQQVIASLLREHTEFAMQLLRSAAHLTLPRHALLRRLSDFPLTHYSVDAVYLIEGRHSTKLGAVIFVVQLEPEEDKRPLWLEAVVTCHLCLEKPVTLVVVTLAEHTAQWCAEPYIYDHRGNSMFCPLVVGPKQIPRITDPEQARALPPLAFLSVAAHGKEPDAIVLVQAALAACATLPTKEGALFADFVLSMLSSADQDLIEELMSPRSAGWQISGNGQARVCA